MSDLQVGGWRLASWLGVGTRWGTAHAGGRPSSRAARAAACLSASRCLLPGLRLPPQTQPHTCKQTDTTTAVPPACSLYSAMSLRQRGGRLGWGRGTRAGRQTACGMQVRPWGGAALGAAAADTPAAMRLLHPSRPPSRCLHGWSSSMHAAPLPLPFCRHRRHRGLHARAGGGGWRRERVVGRHPWPPHQRSGSRQCVPCSAHPPAAVVQPPGLLPTLPPTHSTARLLPLFTRRWPQRAAQR